MAAAVDEPYVVDFFSLVQFALCSFECTSGSVSYRFEHQLLWLDVL